MAAIGKGRLTYLEAFNKGLNCRERLIAVVPEIEAWCMVHKSQQFISLLCIGWLSKPTAHTHPPRSVCYTLIDFPFSEMWTALYMLDRVPSSEVANALDWVGSEPELIIQ